MGTGATASIAGRVEEAPQQDGQPVPEGPRQVRRSLVTSGVCTCLTCQQYERVVLRMGGAGMGVEVWRDTQTGELHSVMPSDAVVEGH